MALQPGSSPHRIHLVPLIVLGKEIQCHHVTTHGGHLEPGRGSAPEWRKTALELVDVAGTTHGLAPLALLAREDLRQRSRKRRLLRNHQNKNHSSVVQQFNKLINPFISLHNIQK